MHIITLALAAVTAVAALPEEHPAFRNNAAMFSAQAPSHQHAGGVDAVNIRYSFADEAPASALLSFGAEHIDLLYRGDGTHDIVLVSERRNSSSSHENCSASFRTSRCELLGYRISGDVELSVAHNQSELEAWITSAGVTELIGTLSLAAHEDRLDAAPGLLSLLPWVEPGNSCSMLSKTTVGFDMRAIKAAASHAVAFHTPMDRGSFRCSGQLDFSASEVDGGWQFVYGS